MAGAPGPQDDDDQPASVNSSSDKEVHLPRLTTRIEGEEARLLVHIEPVDDGEQQDE